MAQPNIRYFPIFYGNKKVAEGFENDETIDPHRQAMFGADGYFGHTRGAVTTAISLKLVVPVAGVSIKMVQDCISQNDIDIGIPVNGQFQRVTMAITKNTMTANSETGVCTGTLDLEGGKPDLT